MNINPIKSRIGIIVISMFIIFLSTRLFYLDRDVPPWDVTMYSSLDEQLYVIPAFNMYNYGSMKNQVVDWLPDDIPMLTNSMLGNLMTFVTFKIFGNNYYGLRISAVMASFVVVVLLFKLLWLHGVSICEKKKIDGVAKIAYLVITIFVIINFPFMMASRVYETTIIRMMAMMVLVYLGIIYFDDKRTVRPSEVFLFGLLVGFGVWFVYITNIFFLPAFGLFVLVQGIKKGRRNGSQYLTLYCLGVFVSIIFHSAVYYAIYDQFYWKEILGYINDSRWGIRRVNVLWVSSAYALLKSIVVNMVHFFKTNIFLLNPVVLVLFICSIPIIFYKNFKNSNDHEILVGLLLIFLFAQSLFLNDFFIRKLVLLFPLVVIFVFSAIVKVIIMINGKDLFFKEIKKIDLLIYTIIGSLIIFALISGLYRQNSSGKNILIFNDYLIGVNGLIHFVVASLLLFLYILIRKTNLKKICLFFFLLLLFIPEIYYDYNYIFRKPEFKHRDAMQNIAELIDGKKGTGFAMGMRLYNQGVAYKNGYVHHYKNKDLMIDIIEKLIQEDKLDYTIEPTSSPKWWKDWMAGLGFQLINIFELPINGEVGLYMKNH